MCWGCKKGGVNLKKITKYFVALTIIISSLTLGNAISTHAYSGKLVDSKTTSSSTTYLNGVKSGKAKICLKNQIGGIRVNVYDNDGGSNYGPLILNGAFIGNNDCVTFDATPYIDGTDNDAEFIVVTTRTPIGSYTLELWD